MKTKRHLESEHLLLILATRETQQKLNLPETLGLGSSRVLSNVIH